MSSKSVGRLINLGPALESVYSGRDRRRHEWCTCNHTGRRNIFCSWQAHDRADAFACQSVAYPQAAFSFYTKGSQKIERQNERQGIAVCLGCSPQWCKRRACPRRGGKSTSNYPLYLVSMSSTVGACVAELDRWAQNPRRKREMGNAVG